MEINVLKPGSTAKGAKLKVSETVFGKEFNETLVHQIINAYLAGARQGSAKQKNRSERKGSTIKPWRQKGTGRARAGSRKGPLWRGGGVTFAARPRDYSQKVNRKMYRSGISSILSELLRTERLVVVKDIELADHKTKTCAEWLGKLEADHALIVTADLNTNLLLGARNIPCINVADVNNLSPVALVQHEKIIFTQAALEKLQEVLA